MQKRCVRRPRCRRAGKTAGATLAAVCAAVAAHLVSPTTSLAITIRDNEPLVNDGSYTSLSLQPQYAPVGAVTFTGFLVSGTLIAPGWVLTAAHATDNPGTHDFRVGGATWDSGVGTISDAQHFAHPNWVADTRAIEFKLTAGNDIGLIQLSTPVTTITPASRYASGLEVAKVGTSVGFGQTGTGTTGDNQGSGTKRAAENMLDAVGGTSIVSNFSSNIVFYDFDNGSAGKNTLSPAGSAAAPQLLEGAAAHGDSGGGLFITIDGRSYLAGAHSFILPPSSGDPADAGYGDVVGSTRTTIYNSWIDDRIANNWDSAVANGTFGSSANWKIGQGSSGTTFVNAAPGQYDIAGFNAIGNYNITFTDNATNHQLLARSGNVTFNLGGFSYTLDSQAYEGSVVVGRYNGNFAVATFNNGTVNSRDAILGEQLGSSGQVNLGTVGNAGTWNVTGDVYLGGTFTSAGGSGTIIINNNSSAMNVTGRLKLYANGRVNYNGGSLSVGTLDFKGGRVILGSGGNKVLKTNQISFDGTSGAKLDLTDNDMIIDYTGSSPLTTIRSYLQGGYANGAWNGTGILSATAAASPTGNGRTAIGFGEAGPIAMTGLNIDDFNTIPVDDHTILLKYTYAGDANLDGMVDRSDLGLLARGWQTSGTWTIGDFNYDGLVNIVDLRQLLNNWGMGIGSPLAPESLASALSSLGLPLVTTSVPEPAALGLVGICLAAAASRRRRRT